MQLAPSCAGGSKWQEMRSRDTHVKWMLVGGEVLAAGDMKKWTNLQAMVVYVEMGVQSDPVLAHMHHRNIHTLPSSS